MMEKKKSTGIWNSVPDLGGSNGALKALAKNVANHLKLTRPEMKRVVAQVVAEHHDLGDVNDYKGYMYYAKPDRIDMTDLITQSKEALDEMVQQKEEQMALSVKVDRSQCNPTKKNATGKKSSTAVFQIENWGRKSLNGVIIDETHLPRGGKEILLAVNRRTMGTLYGGSKKKKKPKVAPPMPASVPVTVPGPSPGPNPGPPSVVPQKAQKKNITPKVPGIKDAPHIGLKIKRINTKPLIRVPKKLEPAKPLANSVPPTANSTLKSEPYRLPAGSSYHPAPLRSTQPKAKDTAAKKPAANGNKSKPPTHRKPVQRQRNYEKPWLVRRSKRNRSKATGQPDEVVVDKSPSRKLPVNKSRTKVARSPRNRVNFTWHTPYQFQGGAGATRRTNDNASKINLQRVKSNLKTKSKSKLKLSQGVRKETPHSRRLQLNKLLQARLIKDLIREEAIDEPERLEAGDIRPMRGKKRREKKTQPDNHPEPIIEIRGEKPPQQNESTKSKSKTQAKPKIKPIKSARFKRIPKKLAGPSLQPNTKATIRPAIPQHLPPAKNPHSTPRRTPRSRPVPVGSSLGSIGLMRWNKHNGGTSTSILTPAKRHLTIAFLNKRMEERNQRQLPVPWK